jgi:hypothetical protein
LLLEKYVRAFNLKGGKPIRLYQALGKAQNNQQALELLFDSKSIEKRIPKLSRRAISVLKYYEVNPLVFRRTEYPSKSTLLQQIPEIRLMESNGRKYVETPDKGRYGLRKYADMDAQYFGKEILKKQELTKEEVETIQLIFIQDALNQFRGSNLLVSENSLLLSHRIDFQRKFSTTPLNIVTMEEAAEFIDLSFKYNSQFVISKHTTTSKNSWYWFSFRLKVPHYNVDMSKVKKPNLIDLQTNLVDLLSNTMMDGFSQRVCFLLMCIDEMGFQYYSGVNNVTMDDMIYHFNYFILLMTGVFDSLALQTMDTYQLTFKDSDNPSRISLNCKNGKDFLKALRAKNRPLREHIQNNNDLIQAPYLLREVIVHREGLHATTFDNNGWQANLISVHQDFVECLKRLGDTNQNYKQLTNFGIYSGSFLSPYIFSKKITSLLLPFCDKYLQLLGYPSFIEQQSNNDANDSFSFSNTLALFKEDNLGF